MPEAIQNNPNQTPTDAQRRCDIISAIESERSTKVITYVLSDRRGSQAQIAEDAVRPMYDHLRSLGDGKKIDLFLYSVGGHTEVPWRIVTMVRECAEEFSVLIPYKALSAATLIALGADQIIMGRKGELGPIDPQLSIQRGRDGETAVQEQIAVEDIMSYIRFVREKSGLSDQNALVGPVTALTNKLEPWILGQINRVHSHIRSVARKLLTARSKQQSPDEQRIQVIVETLTEKIYQHGHAIGRKEAEEIGLKITRPSESLEKLMWELYEDYENLCKLREPVEPRTFVPAGQDEHTERVVMGAIESSEMSHQYSADLRGRNKRQVPPQLSLNLNVNLQLPPNINPAQLPSGAQQVFQQMVQQLQQQLNTMIQDEVRKQMPVVGFEGWVQSGAWRRTPDWPT